MNLHHVIPALLFGFGVWRLFRWAHLYWRPKLQDAVLDRRIRTKCRRGAYDPPGGRL